MQKLSRSFTNVLKKLAEKPEVYHNGYVLPNGHGHTHPHGATGTTLINMKQAGLIEYGKEPEHSHYGWKITPAGIEALKS
jgi:hypothetical protein